jgi:ParB family chromosome partitioning protein
MARTNVPPRRNPLGPIGYLVGGREADALDDARALRVDRLSPNPFQPRQTFDASALDELAASIREHGVLQPLLVRPDPGAANAYQIVAGERRWRAAQRAGLDTVPGIVRDLDDAAMELLGLLENIQRTDLNAADEAEAFRNLMERRKLSTRELGDLIGKSHAHVVQRLRLLDNPDITAAVRSGALSPTVALSVDRVAGPARDDLLKRAQAGEHITVEEARAARTAADQPKVENNLPAVPALAPLDPPTRTDSGQRMELPTATMTVDQLPLAKATAPGYPGEGTGDRFDQSEGRDRLAPPSVVNNLPLGPPSSSSSASPSERPTPQADAREDNRTTFGINDATSRHHHQATEEWMRMEELRTIILFQATNGRATREQLQAALWADLEALDG